MATEYEKYTQYYLKQEVQKCRFCGKYIDTDFIKVTSNRVDAFYHRICYDKFKSNLELLYSF